MAKLYGLCLLIFVGFTGSFALTLGQAIGKAYA